MASYSAEVTQRLVPRTETRRVFLVARSSAELASALWLCLFVAFPLLVLFGGLRPASWSTVVSQPGTRIIIARTLWLTAIVTFGALLCALLIASLARRRRSLATGAVALLLIPLLGDQLARNYGWYFLLRANGILNAVSIALHLPGSPYRLLYTFGSVAVAMIQGLFPLCTIPLLLAVLSLDDGPEVAASVLGASRTFRFMRVTAPLLLPAALLGAAFAFAASFGYYITPRMLGGDAGLTVAGLLEQRVNLLLDWPGATALASVIVVACSPCVALYVRQFERLSAVSGFAALPRSPRRSSSPILTLLLLALALTPLIPVFLSSISDSPSLSFPPHGLTAKWYIRALTAPVWTSAWSVSILDSSVAALVATILAIG